MPRSPIRSVLVTADPTLRETIQGHARVAPDRFVVVADLEGGASGLTGPQFRTIQQAAPALVFIDLEEAPELGLSLARDLVQASPQLVPVAVGRAMAPEVLLQAMRGGVAEYLLKPVESGALQEALDRLAPRVAGPVDEAGASAKVIACFSAKGGSGASTAATNVAIELHRRFGLRTLLVDLDAELGEIALLLGVQPQFNFVDLIQNFHRMDTNLLTSYIEQHGSGVHLLSAPFHPDRAAAVTEDQIRQILLYLKGQYDLVVVDTSKSFSAQTLAAFAQADEVLLLATVDLPSLRNIQRALPLLRRVVPGGGTQVRLVINRYDATNEITLKDVERLLDLPVFATLANDYEALIKSVNAGRPAVLGGGKSDYVRDIRSLAARLMGEASQADGARRGLFARLTGAKKGEGKRG